MKRLATTMLIFGVFFSWSYKTSFAQGTFSCLINHAGQCFLKDNNCDSGYGPAQCVIWDGQPQACTASHPCIPDGLASKCTTKTIGLQPCPPSFPIQCAVQNLCCETQEACNLNPGSNSYFSCDPGTGDINDGIYTALGCIPKDINELAGWVFSKLIYIASGIAFLLMAMGAIMVLTSSGTPEKIKAGKELITSALSGLLFIILSLFILRLIGVDILQIPGFTK